MIHLGVNIDHVATLRQARGGEEPSVCEAADIVVSHGSDSLTVHLREDRRHIQDHDVTALKKQLSVGLNLEMSIAPEIVAIAVSIQPEQVTLVPEKREELTTEGGLDVAGAQESIARVVHTLTKAGIRVSMFIDPVKEQVLASHAVGAQCIELHTGEYANATTIETIDEQYARLEQSARDAHEVGLIVNAGHGLNYQNVSRICQLPHLYELNIGHSIISRAVFTGLGTAVSEMKKLLSS